MTQAAALRIAFAGMAALAVAMGIGRFAFTPLLPLMQDDAGLSVAAGGYLASANYLGYFLGSLLATRMHVRDDTAVLGSMMIIGIGTIAMGFTESYPLWLVLRLIAGIANAWIAIFAFSWCLDRLAVLKQPLLNSMIFAGVGAGTMVVGALCVLLTALALRTPQMWIALGLLALTVTVVVWRTYRGGGNVPHAARPRGGGIPWTREARLLVFCFGVSGFGYIIPATFLPAMARSIINDPAVFGWAWPVFGAAAMLSTLGAATLLRAFHPRRVWMTCHFVMAFGVIIPALSDGLGAIILAALFVGGTFMVITMLSIQEARAAASAHVVQLTAAMTAAFALGQILGPVVASLMLDAGWGFQSGLLLAGGLLVVSGAMLWRPTVQVARP